MIKRTKGAGRLSFTPQGNVSGEVGGRPITFSPRTGTVTTPVSSGEVGNMRYQAGVGANLSNPMQPLPAGYVTAQGQSGDFTYGGTAGTQGAGFNAGYSTEMGNNRLTVTGSVDASGNVGVTPTYQIGNTEASSEGAQWGGRVGGAVGSYFGPVGSAVGSLIGSAAGSAIGGATGGGRNRKEHDVRNNVIKAMDNSGFWDKETRLATNPDGSTFDFSQTGKGGEHGWANVDRRHSDHSNRDNLFSYDTDYTNDLDYVSNMAGSTLSRLLMGKVNKAADQFGGQLGNAFLGKSGYGAQMTKETFENTMNNARSYYAKAGIGTKEDLLGLANKLYADGQIKDVDYAVMQQTAGMLYDNDFATAQKLMAGRDKGIAEATKTPSGGRAKSATPEQVGEGAAQKGRVWQSTPQDRIISAEEAWAQTRPFFDMYRAEYGSPGAGGGMSGVNKGASVMAALQGANKLTSAITGRSALDWARAAYDAWNTDTNNPGDVGYTNPETGNPSWLENIQDGEFNAYEEQNMTPMQEEQNMTPIDWNAQEEQNMSAVPEDWGNTSEEESSWWF